MTLATADTAPSPSSHLGSAATVDTPSRVCLVATRYHLGTHGPSAEILEQAPMAGHAASTEYPQSVVTGLRQIYWQVFDFALDMRLPASCRLQLNGASWEVQGLSLFVSEDRARRLGANDGRYLFVVAELTHPQRAEGGQVDFGEINHLRNEQAAVGEVFGALASQPGLEWLAGLSHARGLPPLFYLQDIAATPALRFSRAGLFAFGAFQRLLMWQVDRMLALIPLDEESATFEDSMIEVLKVKQLSVNIHRFFLTHSISNNAEMKAFVASVRQRYRLREEFDRIPEVNTQMQEFLTLRSQLELLSKTTRLNRTMAVTAIAGLPIALGSMLLALSPENALATKPLAVLSKSEIQLFLLCVVFFALPLFLMLMIGRRRKKADRRN